jgi:hypothetical protein
MMVELTLDVVEERAMDGRPTMRYEAMFINGSDKI